MKKQKTEYVMSSGDDDDDDDEDIAGQPSPPRKNKKDQNKTGASDSGNAKLLAQVGFLKANMISKKRRLNERHELEQEEENQVAMLLEIHTKDKALKELMKFM